MSVAVRVPAPVDDLVARLANAEAPLRDWLRALDDLPRTVARRARQRYEALRRTNNARESLDTIAGELQAGAFGRLRPLRRQP